MTKKYQFQLNFKKSGGEYVLFGLPQTNCYHTIFDLSISPSPYIIIDEGTWGNKQLVIRLNDVKNETKINFSAYLNSFVGILDLRASLQSYNKQTIQSSIFLKPNRFMDGQNEKIIQLASNIVGKEKKLAIITKKLYEFALQYLTYGRPTKGLYTYNQAMEERVTDCGGFSTFLASLLQSQKIPSRLVVGFLVNGSIVKNMLATVGISHFSFADLTMHAWLEILLPDNHWFPLDPSIEWRRRKGKTNRKGGFGTIPSDRLVTSFGQDFKIRIDSKLFDVDLLQNPIYL